MELFTGVLQNSVMFKMVVCGDEANT